MNGLVATYSELFLRVLTRLMPLQNARLDISINNDMYDKAQAEISRILAEMVKLNETAKADDFVFGALQRSLSSYTAQADSYSAARGQAWDDFNRLNIEFSRQLLTDLRLVGKEQIPVLIEIRRDLGLDSNIEEFRKQMDSNWERMSQQNDALLSKLQLDG